MIFARIILAALMLLAAPITGTMAGTHAPKDGHAVVMADVIEDLAECCSGEAERVVTCQADLACIPLMASASLSLRATAMADEAVSVPVGHDPAGPLDPPRFA